MVHSAKNVTEEDHAERRQDERGRETEVPETGGTPVCQGQPDGAQGIAYGDGVGDGAAPQEPATAAARADAGSNTPATPRATKALRGVGGRRDSGGVGEPGLRVCGAPDAGTAADGAAAGPVGRTGPDRRGGGAPGAHPPGHGGAAPATVPTRQAPTAAAQAPATQSSAAERAHGG